MQLDMHASEVQSLYSICAYNTDICVVSPCICHGIQRQMDHNFSPYPIVIAQDSGPYVGMLECWIIGNSNESVR